MFKIRPRKTIKEFYDAQKHDFYDGLALGVEYYLAQKKEKNPQARFLWEQESWIIQYLPLFLSYRSQLSFISWVNTHEILNRWGGLYFTKYEIYRLLPSPYIPQTIFIPAQKSFFWVQKEYENASLRFPFIAKPDGGTRSMGVRVISSWEDLKSYHKEFQKKDYLLQEFIDLPYEYGVLCVWDLEKKRFRVTSFARKDFFSVKGDGKHNFKALIKKAPDLSEEQKQNILEAFSLSELEEIIPSGEEKSLARFASIRYGTLFKTIRLNPSDHKALEEVFNEVLKDFPGFYAGRFDIKAAGIKEILEKKFKILELNPVTSVPQHIEDAELPVWEKYREMKKHLQDLEKIAENNKKENFSQKKDNFLKGCFLFFWRSKDMKGTKKEKKTSLWKGLAVLGGVLSILWFASTHRKKK